MKTLAKTALFSLLILSQLCIYSCQDAIIDPVTGNSEKAVSILPAPKIIQDIGRVQYIDLEGGFWGIAGSRGNYEPLNLSKEFCVNGLWVMFTAEQPDIPSIHMWGKVIRLISIVKASNILISDTGTIMQSGIQGNPWLIDGVKAVYQALNLPAMYQIPGLKVNFSGILRTDIGTIPRLWPIIEILKIVPVSDPLYFSLGQEFKLPVARIAANAEGKILFGFESVLSDSRCPSGAVCVWEGEAICLVSIMIKGVNYGQYKLSTRMGADRVTVAGYSFILTGLLPYPSLKDTSFSRAYVGTFLIDRISL